MEAVLLRKVRFRFGQLVLTAQGRGFPGGTAFFLVSADGIRLPLAGPAKGRTLQLSLPEGLREGDWHLEPRVRLSEKARKDLLLLGSRMVRGEDLLFPLGGDGEELLLRVRRRTAYDGPLIWLRERLAFALSIPLKRLGAYRGAWVVFEKFCGQAQDNGVAFFRYCQKNLPEEKRRKVFFILDQACPAYEPLSEEYGAQVVPFMSLRHMLLMMLSSLYVASESRYHGYQFRCVPNPVFRQIRRGKQKIFFLQHGVTAMKRVDPVFGAHGFNPMDYFAVTSRWEQKIIVEHFGYPEERVPITGFCRWDEWEDTRREDSPYILIFPTWRGYLDGRDEEAFMASDYFRAYEDLLVDPELGRLLEEEGLEVFFAIHPRLAAMGKTFSSSLPGICLVPYDGQSLPRLLMGASALVTDYSSLTYDALYLERPVILYRFDEERYERETGGYLSAEELPAPLCRTIPETVAALKALAKEGFPPGKSSEELFAYRDHKACERTVRFLEKEGF